MGSISRKELGLRLAKLRQRVGLSQARAAEQAGLSDETVSRVERGAQGISIEALGALSEAYGVDIADVLRVDSEDSGEKSEAIHRVVALLRRQSIREIEIGSNLLQTLFRDLSSKKTGRQTR